MINDRRTALILFVLVSTIYTISAVAPIGNPGSHYMLLRSMADHGRFYVDGYEGFSGGDYSFRDGHYYTDKPPGTAVIALPLYEAASVLPGPIGRVPQSGRLDDDRRVAYLAILSPLAGAGIVVLLYFLLRGYGLSTFSAAAAGLVYAFATIGWDYGRKLYSHSLSGFLILLGVTLAISASRQGRLAWPRGLLLGVVAGLAVLVDYSNIVFVGGIVLYLILTLNQGLASGEGWWKTILAFGAGGLPSAIFLLWYNTVSFGGPLVNSYTYKVNYLPANDPTLTFSTPIWKGLIILLFYGSTPYGPVANKGIFLLMPVTLTAIAGVWLYFKQHRKEAGLVVGLFVAFLLLFSTHFTPDGGSGDSRYLSPTLPLLFVPIAFVIEHIRSRVANPDLRDGLLFALCGLIFISAVFVLEQFIRMDTISAIFDRAAKLSTTGKMLRLFNDVFGNWRNAPLLWLVEGVGIGIAAGVAWLWRRLRASLPAAAPGE